MSKTITNDCRHFFKIMQQDKQEYETPEYLYYKNDKSIVNQSGYYTMDGGVNCTGEETEKRSVIDNTLSLQKVNFTHFKSNYTIDGHCHGKYFETNFYFTLFEKLDGDEEILEYNTFVWSDRMYRINKCDSIATDIFTESEKHEHVTWIDMKYPEVLCDRLNISKQTLIIEIYAGSSLTDHNDVPINHIFRRALNINVVSIYFTTVESLEQHFLAIIRALLNVVFDRIIFFIRMHGNERDYITYDQYGEVRTNKYKVENLICVFRSYYGTEMIVVDDSCRTQINTPIKTSEWENLVNFNLPYQQSLTMCPINGCTSCHFLGISNWHYESKRLIKWVNTCKLGRTMPVYAYRDDSDCKLTYLSTGTAIISMLTFPKSLLNTYEPFVFSFLINNVTSKMDVDCRPDFRILEPVCGPLRGESDEVYNSWYNCCKPKNSLYMAFISDITAIREVNVLKEELKAQHNIRKKIPNVRVGAIQRKYETTLRDLSNEVAGWRAKMINTEIIKDFDNYKSIIIGAIRLNKQLDYSLQNTIISTLYHLSR